MHRSLKAENVGALPTGGTYGRGVTMVLKKVKKLKRDRVYAATDCCREVRLGLLGAKKGDIVRGWSQYCDGHDAIEVWQLLQVNEDPYNSSMVKFIGYEYEYGTLMPS